MKLRPKPFILILVATVLLFLSGCNKTIGPQENEGGKISGKVSAEEEPKLLTGPYTGPKSDYKKQYNQGLESKMEDRVIFVANHCLSEYHGFPKLLDKEVYVHWIKDPNKTQKYNAYDDQLHKEFISGINYIIKDLPNMKEQQMSNAVNALLSKLKGGLAFHITSYKYVLDRVYYQIQFRQLEKDGQSSIYCVGATDESKAALGLELVSINSVPIEEVLDRLHKFNASDNKLFSVYGNICQTSLFNHITCLDSLIYAGIANESDGAVYEFKSGGEMVFIKPSVMRNVHNSCTVDYIKFSESQLITEMGLTDAYKYEYIEDNSILYIRYQGVLRKNNYKKMISNIIEETKGKTVRGIIIDLRDYKWYSKAMSYRFEELEVFADAKYYVCINSATRGSAALMAKILKDKKNSVLIGSPTSEGTMQFTNFSEKFTRPIPNRPNEQFLIDIPREIIMYDEQVLSLLEPDVSIIENYEDYQLGKDSLIEYVKIDLKK